MSREPIFGVGIFIDHVHSIGSFDKGMFSNLPPGSFLLIVIGNALALSSNSAIVIGSDRSGVTVMSIGAPREIWRALDPTILDLSYFVNGNVTELGRSFLSTPIFFERPLLLDPFAGEDKPVSLSFSSLPNPRSLSSLFLCPEILHMPETATR